MGHNLPTLTVASGDIDFPNSFYEGDLKENLESENGKIQREKNTNSFRITCANILIEN